jgi:hypothetical protein
MTCLFTEVTCMFLEGLCDEVAADIFGLPEWQTVETLTLARLLELGKHTEQTSQFCVGGGYNTGICGAGDTET